MEKRASTIAHIGSFGHDVQTFAKGARGHWGVENGLHWVLDVAFREDDSRVRKGHAPENLALLRHIAVNLLKQEKTAKAGHEEQATESRME